MESMKPNPAQLMTGADLAIAYQGPALAANKCMIGVVPTGIRIAFIETYGAMTPVFRTAVVMSCRDAAALRDTLGQILDSVQARVDLAAKPADGRA